MNAGCYWIGHSELGESNIKEATKSVGSMQDHCGQCHCLMTYITMDSSEAAKVHELGFLPQ